MAKSLLWATNNDSLIFSDELYGVIKQTLAASLAGNVVCVGSTVATEPAANAHPQTYFRVDESGKQQWCVRFTSGVVQVLATEP